MLVEGDPHYGGSTPCNLARRECKTFGVWVVIEELEVSELNYQNKETRSLAIYRYKLVLTYSTLTSLFTATQ